MDQENKKRGRKEEEEEYPARKEAPKAKKKKQQQQPQQQQQQRGGSNAAAAAAAAIEEGEEKGWVFEASAAAEAEDTCRSRGVFEFPWDDHCGEALDGSDLQDVFFSSLVDGRSAAIGVPGDRLSPPTAGPIALPDEASPPSDAEGDADGLDCIWSTVLREPLAVVCTRGFRA